MIALDDRQIAELEQKGFEVARAEDGNVVSVTRIVDPGPLIVGDEEYLREIFEVQGIMRAMHAPDKEFEPEWIDSVEDERYQAWGPIGH